MNKALQVEGCPSYIVPKLSAICLFWSSGNIGKHVMLSLSLTCTEIGRGFVVMHMHLITSDNCWLFPEGSPSYQSHKWGTGGLLPGLRHCTKGQGCVFLRLAGWPWGSHIFNTVWLSGGRPRAMAYGLSGKTMTQCESTLPSADYINFALNTLEAQFLWSHTWERLRQRCSCGSAVTEALSCSQQPLVNVQ